MTSEVVNKSCSHQSTDLRIIQAQHQIICVLHPRAVGQMLDHGVPAQVRSSPVTASSDRQYSSLCLPGPGPCWRISSLCRSEGATMSLARNRAEWPSRSRSNPHRPCSRGSVRPSAAGSASGQRDRYQHRALSSLSLVNDSRPGPHPRLHRPQTETLPASYLKLGRSIGPHGHPSGDAAGSPARRRHADASPLATEIDHSSHGTSDSQFPNLSP